MMPEALRAPCLMSGNHPFHNNAANMHLNGEIETRKRKKIVDGDTIECLGDVFQVKFTGDPNDTEETTRIRMSPWRKS